MSLSHDRHPSKEKLKRTRVSIASSAVATLIVLTGVAPQAMATTNTPSNAPPSMVWTSIGPAPIVNGQLSQATQTAPVSGRVDCITVSGSNVYVGAAGGGVWQTSDGGQTWAPLSDMAPSLAIGSITVDPTDPDVIYAGTGELHYSADSYYGHGILKSTNGGKTWTLIGQSTFDGGYISQVLINPAATNDLLVSCDEGVFASTDGGTTWTQVLNEQQHSSYSMVMNPAHPNVVYASVGTVGLFKSDDFGATWTRMTGGLPTKDVGVASIAIDPSNPSTLYTSISTGEDTGFELMGIYKSTDGGDSWTQLPGVPAYFDEDYAYGQPVGNDGQGDYDNCIAVDPTNPKHIVAGGVTLIESNDGGQTWHDLTMPNSPDFAVDMHPDFHAITFDSMGTMYVGNDGGVWKRSASGTWTDLNTNLSISQFYGGMSVSPDGSEIIGGTQDNGTNVYTGKLGWQHIYDGDGGYTAMNPSNPQIIYAEALQGTNTPGADIERSTDGGKTWTQISPPYQDVNNLPWITPFIQSPENPNNLLVGADRLYLSPNDGKTYRPISPEFNYVEDKQSLPDPIDFVAQAKSDARVIYVGTMYGQVEATFNGGTTWRNLTPANADYNASVAGIVIDPTAAHKITVTFGGFFAPASDHHVFFTANTAAVKLGWQDETGNLPNAPVNVAVLSGSNLYVGTDAGVYESKEGQSRWAKIGTGLPNSPVMSLLITKNDLLIAGTHGRGVFELNLNG